MRFIGLIEIFSLFVAILATYGIVLVCFRCLLPCDIIPNVSALLNNAKQCLASAESSAEPTGTIPAVSGYRAELESLADDLAQIRLESHRSPKFF